MAARSFSDAFIIQPSGNSSADVVPSAANELIMCSSCGCRLPYNSHEDSRNIVWPQIEEAAIAAAIPIRSVIVNMAQASLDVRGANKLVTLSNDRLRHLGDVLAKARLSPDEYRRRYDVLFDDIHERMLELAALVTEDEITPAQFRHRAERALKSAYVQAYRYGVGTTDGSLALADDDLTTIANAFAEDKDYLANFSAQIAEGYVPTTAAQVAEVEGSMLLDERAVMYANSVRSMFYAGRIARTADDVQIEWVLGATEHCDACLDAADGSPYTKDTLPGLPGAAVCDGLDKCGCSLDFSDAPAQSADVEEEEAA